MRPAVPGLYYAHHLSGGVWYYQIILTYIDVISNLVDRGADAEWCQHPYIPVSLSSSHLQIHLPLCSECL